MVEKDRPKKKRKVKFSRLEDWGESKEQEQYTDNITTIQDCVDGEVVVTRAEHGMAQSRILHGTDSIDLRPTC